MYLVCPSALSFPPCHLLHPTCCVFVLSHRHAPCHGREPGCDQPCCDLCHGSVHRALRPAGCHGVSSSPHLFLALTDPPSLGESLAVLDILNVKAQMIARQVTSWTSVATGLRAAYILSPPRWFNAIGRSLLGCSHSCSQHC